MRAVVLESVLTRPHCGSAKRDLMPRRPCLFYWGCPQWRTLLRPKPRDCCLFCSFGSVPCPPSTCSGDTVVDLTEQYLHHRPGRYQFPQQKKGSRCGA
ncbi:GDCCVxC domain-containing (seleno)protein [Ralstonia psammae]|uniref:GDCCVxC domain-containing (seleno)protein n=1 Tax=Ralstonia psammae TaxID=3058598 RepID=UPI003D167D2B